MWSEFQYKEIMVANIRGANIRGVTMSVISTPAGPLVFDLTSPGSTFPGDSPFRNPADTADYTGGTMIILCCQWVFIIWHLIQIPIVLQWQQIF